MTDLPQTAIVPLNKPRRRVPIMVWVLIVLAGLASWYVYALSKVRESVESTIASGRTHSIVWGLLNYIDKHKRFPPAVLRGPDGTPWHSWRVLLLPYIDKDRGEEFYKVYRFDEPWNSPGNLQAANLGCRYYAKRQPFVDSLWGIPGDEVHTRHLALVGRNTVFRLTESLAEKELDESRNQELIVVESAVREVLWTEPVDIDVDAAGAYEAIWGKDERATTYPNLRGLRANLHRVETLKIPKAERLTRARIPSP